MSIALQRNQTLSLNQQRDEQNGREKEIRDTKKTRGSVSRRVAVEDEREREGRSIPPEGTRTRPEVCGVVAAH